MSKKWQWKEHTRQEWIDLHNSPDVITASEVATILSLNKYESAFALWHRKKGHTPPVEETIAMRVGNALEDMIQELYEEATGRMAINPGDYTMASHPDMPWFMGTLDRYDDENRAVELKTAGVYAMPEWEDSGPIGYQIQNQSQLLCASLEKGALCGLVGNNTFFHYDFDRHDRICDLIEKEVIEFMDRLQNDDPPPVDETESTAETLKALHPKDNGKTAHCDGAALWMDKRLEIKGKMTHLERDLLRVENQIKSAIGDNTHLWDDGQHMTYKWQTRKGHVVAASEFRVLRTAK